MTTRGCAVAAAIVGLAAGLAPAAVYAQGNPGRQVRARSDARARLRKMPRPRLKNPFLGHRQRLPSTFSEPQLKNPFRRAGSLYDAPREWRVTLTVTVEQALPEPRLKNPFTP